MSDTPASNADGCIDYSSYSDAKLYGVLQRIDAERYPLNLANVKATLAARGIIVDDAGTVTEGPKAPVAPVAPVATVGREFRVAFAPESGPLTWLGPSRNEFRLVGAGTITFDGPKVVVRGRRFGFILGLPLRQRIYLFAQDIVNVECEANVVRMECRAGGDKLRSLTFWLQDPAAAAELVQLLPTEKTFEFQPQLASHVAFEQRLLAHAPRLPVTYGFAALCVLMFIVTVFHGAHWFKTTGVVEIAWGSNFGPSTIGGEWWRLLTYSVLHFGILHLAFNMWALVSFGTIAERLFGSVRYAIICLVSGVAGGLASIAARPGINSAGASAVILGIFGALLVSHLRGAESIPTSVARSLRNSTLVFTVCVLAAGFVASGVDNGAHVGGLAAGLCVGLALQSPRLLVRIAAPTGLVVLMISTGVILQRRLEASSASEAQFMQAYLWFVPAETVAMDHWHEVWELARKSQIGDIDAANRLDRDVLRFWREASRRFKPIQLQPTSEQFANHEFLRTMADGRVHAVELCVSGLRKSDVKVVSACIEEMHRGDTLIDERVKALAGGK